ncbi:MAG: hypothetical protein FJ315_04825 [SAR202 cluster bacterium]|nr:hypothetical protein [SAR202 cluster bacterium]
MATATATGGAVVIPTGQEKVFEYLSNPVSMREWMPEGHWDVWLTTPPPIKTGDAFRARRSGTLEEYEGTVKEYEANRRIVLHLTRGSMETIWSFDLVAQSGGTAVRCAHDVHTHGVLRLAERVMRRGAGHGAHDALRKLQAHFWRNGERQRGRIARTFGTLDPRLQR